MGFRIAKPNELINFTSDAKTSYLLWVFHFDPPLDIHGKRTILLWLVWT